MLTIMSVMYLISMTALILIGIYAVMQLLIVGIKEKDVLAILIFSFMIMAIISTIMLDVVGVLE